MPTAEPMASPSCRWRCLGSDRSLSRAGRSEATLARVERLVTAPQNSHQPFDTARRFALGRLKERVWPVLALHQLAGPGVAVGLDDRGLARGLDLLVVGGEVGPRLRDLEGRAQAGAVLYNKKVYAAIDGSPSGLEPINALTARCRRASSQR